MPNQNDPTQTPNPVNPPVDQSSSQSTPPVPTIFPQSDLPPLPPAFQNLPEDGIPSNGSGAPPETSSVVPKAKKKFGGGRIIATILGLIVLVGGVGAGILLTRQPQLFQQKATGNTVDCGVKPDGSTLFCNTDTQVCCNTGCKSKTSGCEVGNEPQGVTRCSNDSNTVANCRDQLPGYEFCLNGTNMHCIAQSGTLLGCGQDYGGSACVTNPNAYPVDCVISTNPCGGGGNCRKWICPQGDTNKDGKCQTGDTGASYTDYTDCSNINCGGQCCQIDWLNSPGGGYCTNARNCKEIKLDCSPSTSPPSSVPTPTPTPTPTPQAPSCISVKAYDDSWTVLSSTQLSTLTTGDVVNFCVNGSAAAGTLDKAQFIINTTLKPETVTKRPSSSDFCQPYTILSTDTMINVKAKVHHSSGVWVGEAI